MADVFDWRLEDAFHVLREAGFLLHDDNRGEWSPYDIYRHLMEQGRISTPMPVLRDSPEGIKNLIAEFSSRRCRCADISACDDGKA